MEGLIRFHKMRKTITLLVMLFATIYGWGQRTVLSGTVTDAVTGKTLPRASVKAADVTVVTNDDGFFTLKCDTRPQTLTVSHVGYKSQHVTLNIQTDTEAETPLNVRLKPTTIQLSEVFVMADDPRELVMAAIKRIAANYARQPELYHCFYRETVTKRQHYISVAEGVMDMYKTPYSRSTSRDRVSIRKGRRLLSPRQGDTLSVKVLGGPVASVNLDLVKNSDILLNMSDLDCYELKMEMPVSIGDRMQYVVSLAPRYQMSYALYFGRLYIDQETLAFTRAELSLDMSDREKATRAILVRKPAGVRFRPKEMSLLVDYRLGHDGVTRISYLRTVFSFNCDWRRRLFATSFTACCEMAVTNMDEGDARPITGRESFDQRDAFFDRVDFFRDPDFWQDYNIIEPTESLDKAVDRLLKRYDRK
jgi:hypothetical protein